MIVTLTPNTTIDLIVFIPKLVPDMTIRATQTYHSMGGKPTDASWILGRMGVNNHAMGLVGRYNRRKSQESAERLWCDNRFCRSRW